MNHEFTKVDAAVADPCLKAPPKEPETAWLVEVMFDGHPRWMSSNFLFTLDVNKALRFARKQDAEQFIGTCVSVVLQELLTATEHQWLV